MRINNNIMAMNTYRQLGIGNSSAAKSMEKLSSGYRINRAGDDAAGLSISEKMRGQIRGLKMASKNAQDGISLIQTAEGALNETHAILQRMRELAVQSANDTNVDIDRDAIQGEIDQLAAEITRIAQNTNFNEQNLLDGTFVDKIFHIGANADQSLAISIGNMDAATLQVLSTTNFTGTATAAETDPNNLADSVDALAYVGPNGTVTFTLGDDFAVSTTNDVTTYELSADITDADAVPNNADAPPTISNAIFVAADTITVVYAHDGTDESLTVNGTAGVTYTATAVAGGSPGVFDVTGNDGSSFTITLESGAGNSGDNWTFTVEEVVTPGVTTYSGSVEVVNANGSIETLTLNNFNPKSDVLTTASGLEVDLADALTTAAAGQSFSVDITGMTPAGIDVSTQASANSAISVIQSAIETVSAERSKLGAVQNRLEHTIKNLDTSAENLQAAESRIRDVDMAQEMMEYTKNNILQQAATAILAQANQAPQMVLQLLR